MRRRIPDQTDAALLHLFESQGLPLLIFFTRRVFDVQTALALTAPTFEHLHADRRRGVCEAQTELDIRHIARAQLNRFFQRVEQGHDPAWETTIDVPTVSPEEVYRVQRMAGSDHFQSRLVRLLGELSQEQRDVIELRIVDGLAFDEVASRLGTSQARARRALSKAVRRLRADPAFLALAAEE